MTLLDGKRVAGEVRARIQTNARELTEQTGIVPGLAVILVGDDPASATYVKNKEKACAEVGFYSEVYRLAAGTTQDALLQLIDRLNADDKIHGILVQLPLPKQIDETCVIQKIAPEKDVDAFGFASVGKIMIGSFDFLPCTPAGVMELLSAYSIDPCGKHAVVIGRSNIVGKPQAMLLMHQNATVTICHSRTRDLAHYTQDADILVVAVGKAGFLTADMVKDGAVVIDVGMNRNAEGKLCGDVDFAAVAPKCSYITPVPGGVGPMTITMLLQNTLTAARNRAKSE